ncbi:MAG TPA: hypothetical protein VEJ23_01490 [Solirubrobacteraceae bacterium]|nr:hypothetical protein [Solirubrobacteraceae bacterium]
MRLGNDRRAFRIRLCRHGGLVLAAFALLVAPSSAMAARAPAPSGSQPWKIDPSPNVAGGNFDELAATFVASANNAWAVGQSRLSGDIDFNALAEEWNGSEWKIAPTASLGSGEIDSDLEGVSGTGPSNVWAVGKSSASATGGLIEHFNGTGWTAEPPTTGEPSESSLLAVSADSTSDAWAVGTSGVPKTASPLIEHFNGKSWSVVSSAEGAGNRLVAVVALSPTNVWAIGQSKGAHQPYSTGVIEHWNGTAWSISLKLTNASETLGSISAVSATNIWAVGSDAETHSQVIEHWNGSEWSIDGPQSLESDGIFGGSLSGVTALSATDVWAIGLGERKVSEDGIEGAGIEDFQLTEHFNGTSWSVVPSDSPFGATSVCGLAGGPLFAVGSGPDENKTFILQQGAP